MKTGVQNVLYDSEIYRIMFVRCENNEILKENKMIVTKQTRVLEALQSGEELTAKQISARFGIKNPTATISNIRLSGFAVYANKRTNKLGGTYTKYRLGTPSREVVAAGYKAMSLGLA
jgi:DNA-binding MarR family transcriptional regulator